MIEKEETLIQYPAVKEQLNLLKETVADDQEHLQCSKDHDAKVRHKTADTSFFGYKTHLAMSEERIITAAVITTGEKSDGKQLHTLIEKSEEAGIQLETVIADAAYSEKENITYSNTNQVNLVTKLNPNITQGNRIEAKNSELKHRHGYDVAKSSGLLGMEIQDAMAIFTVNLKRILKLTEQQ